MSDAVLDKIEASTERALGINVVSRFYDVLGTSDDRLVGYVMNLGYDNATLITNDFYKHRVGGIPKNSFLVVRPEPFEVAGEEYSTPKHLILVRVLEPASTPLSNEVSRTYFEMHKSHMPEIDVFTRSELQWGAMNAAVLGTYYNSDDGAIVFGADIETYYSPHLYAVYSPTAEMLATLVNAFVDKSTSLPIGRMRLTESLFSPAPRIDINVAPTDFVGARTALFGKTRMGKSNTVKIILQMIMDSDVDIGQVVFDLNGEYANRNEQDDTSVYELYADRCVRYSLRDDPEEGVRVLKANFYQDLKLGHSIIRGLWDRQWGKPAAYEQAFLEWEMPDSETLAMLKNDDPGEWTRAQRAISIYRSLLYRAGFGAPAGMTVPLYLKKEIRALAADEDEEIPESVSLKDAAAVYTKVWRQYDPKEAPFSGGRDEYFDTVSESLLKVLSQGAAKSRGGLAGFVRLIPFRAYHSVDAGDLVHDIVSIVDDSKTVIIDLSNAPEEVYEFYSELISRAVFDSQMRKFTSGGLGQHYVQFYFEEAHNLFPRDDKDLRGIYNRLAKEGAKFHIGVVYSTQSIASLSPDLLKNTENFFIAHLNDESEIKALTRYYEFRDVGADVQRTKTRGFVRMITSSHRFALPVQIAKFGPRGDEV